MISGLRLPYLFPGEPGNRFAEVILLDSRLYVTSRPSPRRDHLRPYASRGRSGSQ